MGRRARTPGEARAHERRRACRARRRLRVAGAALDAPAPFPDEQPDGSDEFQPSAPRVPAARSPATPEATLGEAQALLALLARAAGTRVCAASGV
jgi:hypothetical protein